VSLCGPRVKSGFARTLRVCATPPVKGLGHTAHVLAAENLGKRFGSREVFRGITFKLSAGDGLVVRGPNGSGKSTLLRIVAGLLSPSEGSVHLPPGDLRTRLGLSSVELATYPHLTVREHLELAGELRGCESRAEDLTGFMGLSDCLGQLASELSTGLRNRLKLALAVQARPAVLLLDEPGASLDEEGRRLVEHICADQRSRGVLIVATNDPAERRLGNLELELAR
jgi:heme exporter protein A